MTINVSSELFYLHTDLRGFKSKIDSIGIKNPYESGESVYKNSLSN